MPATDMAMKARTEYTDMEARERALDIGASFVVQAPAGSGKTELLMQRYLALLALVEKPEQILALTFTRKAAGEMQERILNAMRKASAGHVPQAGHEAKTIELAGKVLERDALRGWSLLENPNRLKVQTIDSFSASIVRQMPVLSGLSGYSIADEPEKFYREAAGKTAALVEEDGPRGDAVRCALGHLGNSVKGLTERLVVMLSRRDQWLRHVNRSLTSIELRTLLEDSLERFIDEELRKLPNAFPPGVAAALIPLARYAAANVEPGSPIAHLSDLNGLPPSDAASLPGWRGIRELLLTNKNELRKQVRKNEGFPAGPGDAAQKKNEFLETLKALAGHDGFAGTLGRVSILPEPKFLDSEWAALEAILNLLPTAEEMLAESFAQEGKVDFQAVSLAALKALGTDDSPTDLMLSLDLKIQHILVDEYQDTSNAQLSLLEALTRGWTAGDGRTLFVVGDPMQSIYLFREAEVGLFLEARHGHIGTVRMEPLTLSRNFRSQASVVDWVNRTMSRAFPAEEDIFTGAVTYSPSEAVKEAVEGRGVDITLFGARDDYAEAKKAVSILRSIPEGETTAILCRSRGTLDTIVEEIKKAGIRFSAQNIDPLAERMAVRDLVALLRALNHPLDRVAWLACLRAPWCGLSLTDLHALCHGDRKGPVWALLNDRARLDRLSSDGRGRAERLRTAMEKALAVWGRRAPSEVLRGLWISLGGPACLESEADREDALSLLTLVESIESSGAVPIEELESRMKGLYADHSSPGTNLSVMTIHRAKGLEFDNVIIPGLGKYAKADERKLLVWMERGEHDLLLAPIEKRHAAQDSGIYGYMRELQKEKAVNEEIRLLYVAATRAKKSLCLLGHIKAAERGEVRADYRSFLSRISSALTEEMVTTVEATEPADDTTTKALRRLSSGWALPQMKEPLPSSGRFFQPDEDEPRFYWAGETVKHLGTAVHRYFCRISKEGLDKWDERRVRTEATRMRSILKTLGLSDAAAEKAAHEGVDILIKAMRDERGRWTLSPHLEAASELPLTAVVNGEIVRAVIDRTFVDDEGTRWVVDFKTGSHSGGSFDEFLEHERERYRGQLTRYEAVLRAYGETRPIRKGLYYPAHRAWVEV